MRLRLLSLFLAFPLFLRAQAPHQPSAGELQLMLQKLNVVGTALYFAAHPDDENTRLIGYLANERKLRTGYLSLTRGDGGQNLIGPELREQLGLIRTHELLKARSVDGGEQFFSRANDFGFSKHPDETFTIWDREQVLSDAVRVIRQFRPDIIITRFTPERPGSTHGHHTASAILAVEAFSAAADPKRFPEQLKNGLQTWQAKRIVWNTSSFFFENNKDFDKTGLLTLDVGGYNALLGESYGEISARSRSMHKSQGFGSGGARGNQLEYFQHLAGPKAEKDLLEGVDLGWARVPGAKNAGKLLQQAEKQFNPAKPEASVPLLLQARQELQKITASAYRDQKIAALDEVIKGCLGLFLEVTATDFAAIPGQNMTLKLEAVNRSSVPVTLQAIGWRAEAPGLGNETGGAIPDSTVNQTLAQNIVLSLKTKRALPAEAAPSQPYWLRKTGTEGMFAIPDESYVGKPENGPAAWVRVRVQLSGQELRYLVPVVYKQTDPVAGEQYRPLVVVPPVAVSLGQAVYVFADDQAREVQVQVRSNQAAAEGQVKLQLPAGWRAEPASQPFKLGRSGEQQWVSFRVFPAKGESQGSLKAVAELGGKTYSQHQLTINYPHIPTQTLFPEASAKAVRLNLVRKGNRLGYLMGAGDEVPAALRQIGYQVTILGEQDLTAERLKDYDAVIVGIRAYNTLDYLKFAQPRLLEYVEKGGTLVVQYNNSFDLVTDQLGPYPLKLSRDRVTVEGAPVKLLQPNHPVLNSPNKLTEQDFQGWVQERGLYFPGTWDAKYTALLSMNDPTEPAREGSLLVAEYGKGRYIYTALSFFRELPAGVPGAYRLFTNLISVGK